MSLTLRELEVERDLAVDQPAAEMLIVVDKVLARVSELEGRVVELKAQFAECSQELGDSRARVEVLEAELAVERSVRLKVEGAYRVCAESEKAFRARARLSGIGGSPTRAHVHKVPQGGSIFCATEGCGVSIDEDERSYIELLATALRVDHDAHTLGELIRSVYDRIPEIERAEVCNRKSFRKQARRVAEVESNLEASESHQRHGETPADCGRRTGRAGVRAPRYTEPEDSPRIWVGKQVDATYWMWDEFDWLPKSIDAPLNCGDIFVPGDWPEPTVNVRSMGSLRTCASVDWSVEHEQSAPLPPAPTLPLGILEPDIIRMGGK